MHKYSCGPQPPETEPQHYGAYLDWWQMGTYDDSQPLNFSATPGWEDVFAQRPVDPAFFYASKDNVFPPSKQGGAEKHPFLSNFIRKTEQFTKTGSGQDWDEIGKSRGKGRSVQAVRRVASISAGRSCSCTWAPAQARSRCRAR